MKTKFKRMLGTQIRANESNSDQNSPALYNISFATEQPVTRFDAGIGEYQEVLLCNHENVDLTRLNSGTGTLLYNHDWNQHVGGIKSCTVDADKVCRADVQFSEFGIGPEIKGKILEGTLQGVSFGYEIIQYEISGTVLSATKWAPYEISIVTVPADITVGLGRALPVDTEEEEEQTEAVDNQDEENLENEPTEQSEQDLSTEPDAVENTSNEGIDSTVEATEPAEVPQEIDNVEAESAESESTVNETDENSDNSINNSNESGDNTDNKEPDPATQANAEDEENKKELRAMASAFNLTPSATEEILNNFAQGESLENIKSMIRSGTIQNNKNNNKGTRMTTASKIVQDLISGTNTSNFETKNGRAYIPFNTRAAVSFAGSGAALDATEQRGDLFVDAVIGFSALSKLNAQIFSGLSANLDIPVEVPGGDVGWMADDSSVPADHTVAFSKIHLAKRYLGSKALMSRAFIEYASPNGGDKVGEILMKRAAKTLEKAVFTSVSTQVAVANATTATSADVDAKVVEAIGKVGGFHADIRAVMHPNTKADLRQIKVGGNTAGRFMIDDTNGQLRGLEVVESVYVPEGEILIGAWDQLLIGQWGAGVEVEVLRDPTSGGYAVFVWAETDYKLANLETAFAKITLTAAP
jgi:HK97 family phage prohead protease